VHRTARLRDIVFDRAHPAATARFWAAGMDGCAVAPYDDEELARLRAFGITDVEDGPTVLVESSRGGPRLWFQPVPEGNRVHLDLSATDKSHRRGLTAPADDIPSNHLRRRPLDSRFAVHDLCMG
jgi:hypothetical protein